MRVLSIVLLILLNYNLLIANCQANCPSALSVTLPSSGQIIFTGTTTTGDTLSCPGVNDATNGHWYSISNPNSNSITIDSVGSNFDTVLMVHTGSCGATSCVVGNDDIDFFGGNVASSVSLCVLSSSNYFVFIGGFFGNVGNYQLTFTINGLCSTSCNTALLVDLIPSNTISYTGNTNTGIGNSVGVCNSVDAYMDIGFILRRI